MSLSKNRIIDILLKCIPLVYAFYIPLGFYVYVYGSLTGKIDGMYGYFIDIAKILVILLFSSFVVRTCVSEKKNPSKHFVIFAGICILEIVFSVCIHGKYHNSGIVLTTVYLIFFTVEIIAENIAICQLYDTNDLDWKGSWTLLNASLIIILVSRIIFGDAVINLFILFLIGGVMLICREISRVCLVLEYAYGKKKGESSKEGELSVQQEVGHDKKEV
jgi:hypothetical protein